MTRKESNATLLEKLYSPYISSCQQCPLSLTTHHNFVCGQGDPHARLMLIGEAPGKNEDEQGMPFVGKSGMLLTKALECIGINRNNIFITNSVKCRPPLNRKPTPAESKIYKNLFLLKEIEIIKPIVICTLGSTALEALFEEPVRITRLRGKQFSFGDSILIPTYHPAYILRNPKEFPHWLSDLEKAYNFAENPMRKDNNQK